jgi:hypothetical protein
LRDGAGFRLLWPSDSIWINFPRRTELVASLAPTPVANEFSGQFRCRFVPVPDEKDT